MAEFWWRLTHLEPAVLRGLIVASFLLLGSLGVVIAPGIPDALIGFLAALSALIQAIWTRAAVTPNATVAVVVPDPARPDLVAPGEATTTAPPRDIVEAARAAGP